MDPALTVTEDGDYLVIRIRKNPSPVLSKEGKSYVVASTHGNQKTTLTCNGKVVTVGVNAYYPNPDYKRPAK